MSKLKHLCLLALVCLLINPQSASAAAGDTTWVQAHNDKWLDYYNDFDTTINFPDGTTKYRKMIMMFTLGKYVCPGSPTYCSDWDYTVQTYAMNKLGDTVELGRLITPYGKGSRMPASWKQTYYFDVSDFATVLKDSNKIRIHYSGYSGGFTANIKFALIEGTPERTVLDQKTLWSGSWAYGNASNPINDKVAAKTLTAPTGTQAAVCRVNITGHGADGGQCSEFCKKYYQVLKDATVFETKNIWRDNCGTNELYPQSGTWIYDRGNWCPGALVYTNFHNIPSVTAGSTFDLALNFEPYTSSGGASYTVYSNIVYYGPINKTLDASLEDIIAPTSNENYFRENARIGFTTVKIRNTGATPITSIEFNYGVSGSTLTNHTWSGTLAPLKDTIIDLPFAHSLLKASGTTALAYEVNIVKVNTASDDDATNNKMITTFVPTVPLPNGSVIIFKTNKAVNGSGVSETSWKIIDESTGAKVMARENNASETTYRDTVNLPSGVYKFVMTDEGCDGLNFWANPSAGSGNLQVKPTLFTSYIIPAYFSGDFGCGFTHYFYIGDPTSIKYINANTPYQVNIFPNPVHNTLNIELLSTQNIKGTISVFDVLGRVVYKQELQQMNLSIDTKSWTNGLYFVEIAPQGAQMSRHQEKVIIQH